MLDAALVFWGRRYRRPRIIGRARTPDALAGTGQLALERATSALKAAGIDRSKTRPPLFTIQIETGGEEWEALRPSGVWRDFADVDLGDGENVLGFVRRYGDPYEWRRVNDEVGDRIAAGEALAFIGNIGVRERLIAARGRPLTTDTAFWPLLRDICRGTAEAWLTANEDGVSLPTKDEGVWREVIAPLALWHPQLLERLRAVPDPKGGPRPVLQATSLAAFMLASAASAIYRRPSFRRCQHCESWFELARSDALFCSPSCRALFHTAAKARA